jgi:hypothetical protein
MVRMRATRFSSYLEPSCRTPPGAFAEAPGWDCYNRHMRSKAEVQSGSNRESDDLTGMPRFRAAEEEPEEASILLHS